MRKLLVSLGIGQHNAMEIFAVKWNTVSKISKVLLNDVLLDGSSGIMNIITDRLTLGRLQVDEIPATTTVESTKKYIPIR